VTSVLKTAVPTPSAFDLDRDSIPRSGLSSRPSPDQFEYLKKTAKLNMRLPESLLSAIKVKADAQGIPYQRYIRQVLEADVRT
jgi:predicted DNA binding CopG/RHH family protein